MSTLPARVRPAPVSLMAAATLSLLLILTPGPTPAAEAPTEPSIRFDHLPGDHVVVNGTRLWYESEGTGTPILLIAGGPGCSHTSFHPYFSKLADSYRIIYFDAFGRGRSDRASNPSAYTFDRDVEDVEGLRRALGLGKIVVLGHSYGGMVAQAYALRYPQSVRKLVLSCTLFNGEMWQANNDNCNHEIRNQYPETWERIQALRQKGLHSSAVEHQGAYGELPLGLFYFYDASNAARTGPFEVNPDVYYSIAGDDADFLIGGDAAKLDFRRQLANLRMPVLVLAGRFDRVVLPRFSLQFKRYLPRASFHMFEKSGHFPYVEETEETFRVLRGFVGR